MTVSTVEAIKELLRRHGAALHVDLVSTIARTVYAVPASPSTVERACRRLAQNGEIVRQSRGVYAFGVRESQR